MIGEFVVEVLKYLEEYCTVLVKFYEGLSPN